MYVPLRAKTHTSIGQSTLKAKDVATWAKNEKIPAVGLAENNTFAGSLGNSKALISEGVQPLIGAEITIVSDDVQALMVFYAKTDLGHKTLLRMVNDSATTGENVTLETLTKTFEGKEDSIIILTGGNNGFLAQTGESTLEALRDFAHVFVEIERLDNGPMSAEATLMGLAKKFKRPLVATSSMVCAGPDMRTAHQAYLCITSKTYMESVERPTMEDGSWLVDTATFEQRFSDIPEAVEASVHIAKMCQTFVEPKAPTPPAYTFTDGEDVDTHIVNKSQKGLIQRIEELTMAGNDIDTVAYQNRLDHELTLIAKMGFSGYFLIVADFIAWARDNDIPVGPGRGSGAGSLVAYALGITDIDPIAFGLLFERFLNPDRVSMPDFDIDFSQARRGEVISYVRTRYGAENVAHIGTYSLLQARAVVRNVGRVMGLPFMQVDQYAKMIPQNPTNPISLAEAMETEGLAMALESAEESIQNVFDVALKLEGLYAHLSTHAAGVVIADQPIAELVPVHLDDNGMMTTTFDMKDVENSGLVKFDFLGLKNLDIIDEATRFATEIGENVNIDTVNFTDPEVYAKLAEGDGFGVFQVESAGMRRAMRLLNVDSIDDLIALISLYRPGPMDQIETYASVKAGIEETDYPHKSMAKILDETHGVIVYQEQVMKIAQELAGYTLGNADVLRRAMGKKIRSEMEAQKDDFVAGAQAGWVNITLDDGTTRTLHANAQVVVNDGTGRRVPLAAALEEDLDVLL